MPDGDEASAVRFDALLYGIELAYLIGKKYSRARKELLKKVSAVAEVANIPEIQAQADFIQKILSTDYLEQADVNDFEEVRLTNKKFDEISSTYSASLCNDAFSGGNFIFRMERGRT